MPTSSSDSTTPAPRTLLYVRLPDIRRATRNSDAEADALSVALNESTIRGGWDQTLPAETLRDLDRIDTDLRRIAGWDDAQLAELLAPVLASTGEPRDFTAAR